MVFKGIKKSIYVLILFATIGLTAFTLSGCSGGGGGSGGDDSQPEPDITLDEMEILFGSVILEHFSDKTISIQNTGTSNLPIGQIAQANPLSAPFSIVTDNCSGTSLAPSEKCTVQVRFLPTSQGAFTDTFDIPSDDPNKDLAKVSVSGTGRALNVSINQVDTDDCPTVKLFITVTESNDDPQLGLTQSDFSLFENGVLIDNYPNDPDKNFDFSDTVTSPISVALALDYSGSVATANAIPDIEAAAKGFIDQLDLNNNTDEAEVIKFAASIEVKQGFTFDPGDLIGAIDDPYLGDKGETALYDAVWQAIDDTAGRTNERRAVVVISDGKDEGSAKELTEVINNALEQAVPVFTIGLGDVFTPVMQQLADDTGGQFFLAPTSDDLQAIYLQVSEILSNQYVIEYNSSSSGGDTIILDVEVDFNGLEGEDAKEVAGCP